MSVDRAIRRGTKVGRAVVLLLELLADGDWHLSEPILDELARRGLNAAVAHRAAHAIGVEHHKRTGPRGRFEWRIAPGAPPPVWREQPPKLKPPSDPPTAVRDVCAFCGGSIADPRLRKRWCTSACGAEAARLRRILAASDDAEYASVAARLAAIGRPSARQRRSRPAGRSPVERLLANAGLERRQDNGGMS